MSELSPSAPLPAATGPTDVGDDDTVLAALAAWGLGGVTTLPAVRGDADGARLVARAVEERLVGVLALAAQAGAVELSDPVRAVVVERWRDALTWCLRLEVELLDVVERLGTRGIEPLVLKGPASAHLDAPEPSLRTFADLDLLVRGDDLAATAACLSERGATRSWAERRRGFDRRFAKSVTMRQPDGLEIDLHRTLADGVAGVRIPLDRLWSQRTHFDLGGVQVGCLAPVHRVLHTAYHLVLGSPTPRWGSVRDFATHLLDPALTVEAVAAEAQVWGGTVVVARAVDAALALPGIEAPTWARWAAGVDRPPAEQRRIDRQRVEGSGMGRAKLDVLAVLPWRDRAAYAMALLLPSSDHLRSRGLRRWDLVGRR